MKGWLLVRWVRLKVAVVKCLRVVSVLGLTLPALFQSAPASANIAFRSGAVASNHNNSANSLAINKPTGTAQNDVLVATIIITSGDGINPPSGWSAARNDVVGTTVHTESFYKSAGSSEPTSYTFSVATGTARAIAGIIADYTGASQTTSLIVDVANGQSSTSCGTITAPSVTTTVPNDFIVSTFSAAAALNTPTITPSTQSKRGQDQTNNLIGTDVAVAEADDNASQASPGASGTRSATTSGLSGTTNCIGQTIALRPHNFDWDQAGYRWFQNVDSADYLSVESNPTAGDDKPQAMAIDTANDRLYLAGYDSTGGNEWRVEKRKLSTGELCTVQICGTNFGTGGVVANNPSANDDEIKAMALDATNGYIYLAGYDKSPGSTDSEWRVEKRNTSDGSLVTNFGSSGVFTANPTSGIDNLVAIALDTTNGYLYLAGDDSSNAGEWRTEKLHTTNGNPCTAAECGTQFGTNGILTEDVLSTKDDEATALALDAANGYLYIGGYDGKPPGASSTQWRVEKRRSDNGNLCDAANCGTLFGGAGSSPAGVYQQHLGGSTSVETVTCLALDVTNSRLYVGGHDDASGGGEWRVDKLDSTAGTLVTAFGTPNGYVQINPSANDETLAAEAVDVTNGQLYLLGSDASVSSTDVQWRLEKRSTTDASLTTAFNSTGVVQSNPTTGNDQPTAVALDVSGGFVYAGGYSSAGSNQWRAERRKTSDGSRGWEPSALAAANTSYSAPQYQTLRLRFLLRNITDDLNTTDTAQQFKLQYAAKVGTCDTAFVGETYADVPGASAGDLTFLDNPNPSATDATATSALSTDPTDGGNINVPLSYEEANNISTNGSAVAQSHDALWDVALTDFTAFGSYCFRVVTSGGSTLYQYDQIPEVVFCNTARSDAALRHGDYFCEGTKRQFYWSQ